MSDDLTHLCDRCGRVISAALAWNGIGEYEGGCLCPDCYFVLSEEERMIERVYEEAALEESDDTDD